MPSPAQAGDLRRLLGLYEQWHRRVFPYLPFDSFLEELEKLGQTAFMKVSPSPGIFTGCPPFCRQFTPCKVYKSMRQTASMHEGAPFPLPTHAPARRHLYFLNSTPFLNRMPFLNSTSTPFLRGCTARK